MPQTNKTNIIWNFEPVSFPEFKNRVVTAKIDTGADTGAMHCSNIEERNLDGGKVLFFTPLSTGQRVKKDKFVIKYVRSSNGKREKRYFIDTQVILQDKPYEITISLADRSPMQYPVLIGRKFLKKYNFLVDPARQ
jgi:hypothetical protein